MIVVSNTSPLCYLTWIGQLDLLMTLFGGVAIPLAVLEELTAAGAPTHVRQRFQHPPKWLKIQEVEPVHDEDLDRLHPGEREAILLVEKIGADLILLDERDARRIASARGLHVTGLLGVLGEAADRRLVDVYEAIEKLQMTSFRASPILLKTFLDRFKGR